MQWYRIFFLNGHKTKQNNKILPYSPEGDMISLFQGYSLCKYLGKVIQELRQSVALLLKCTETWLDHGE